MANLYVLPKLPYGTNDLQTSMSKDQLELHYTKHHQAYVNGANSILETLEKSRREGTDLDMKSILKALSFNIGGHVLHSLFWNNLAPVGSGGAMSTSLNAYVEREFGSFERFKKEFTQAALSVEGSGWAALVFDSQLKRPMIMQIEKHNTNLYPNFKILMVLDVFEHAYYLDYKNDRAKYIEAFWKIANWNEVNRRLDQALKE